MRTEAPAKDFHEQVPICTDPYTEQASIDAHRFADCEPQQLIPASLTAMSSLFQLSPLHPIAHTSAITLSTLATALGIYALQSPANFAVGWGLKSEAASPLWRVFAGRNISLGLLLTIFSIQGKLREVGTCLMCAVVTASIDGYVTIKYGEPSKKWVSASRRESSRPQPRSLQGHLLPAAVFGTFGGWLVFVME